MYDLMMAMEISRLVHAERLAAAAKHDRIMRELRLANKLQGTDSPWSQVRKAMNRVMSLLF